MIKAIDLRIYNYIGCKVSNDAGIYQVTGIDGWERKYEKEDHFIGNGKKMINMGKKFTDHRLIRIIGGARNNEIYPEYKLKPIKLTDEWIIKLGAKKNESRIQHSFSFIITDKKGKDPILKTTTYAYKEISLALCNDTGKGEYYVFIREGNTDDRAKDDIICITRELKFVHSFQNLFFALTGQELLVK